VTVTRRWFEALAVIFSRAQGKTRLGKDEPAGRIVPQATCLDLKYACCGFTID
jgi:hypothetical protein